MLGAKDAGGSSRPLLGSWVLRFLNQFPTNLWVQTISFHLNDHQDTDDGQTENPHLILSPEPPSERDER